MGPTVNIATSLEYYQTYTNQQIRSIYLTVVQDAFQEVVPNTATCKSEVITNILKKMMIWGVWYPRVGSEEFNLIQYNMLAEKAYVGQG